MQEENEEKLKIIPTKHVFATMLTDAKYMPGVQTLWYSLYKHVNKKITDKFNAKPQSPEKKINSDLEGNELNPSSG